MDNVVRHFSVKGKDPDGMTVLGYFRARDEEEAKKKARKAWVKSLAEASSFYKPEDFKIDHCAPVDQIPPKIWRG
ncbi:hypothetical protein [Laceyella putida]|uniref:Uncharacterized protein n=1 Tax=Laceyella putida TaxID=110101 RepID=A0ABW2RRI3_9BACL